MNPQVKILYECEGPDRQTYVSVVPLETNVPFPRAIQDALRGASELMLSSLARDLASELPKFAPDIDGCRYCGTTSAEIARHKYGG